MRSLSKYLGDVLIAVSDWNCFKKESMNEPDKCLLGNAASLKIINVTVIVWYLY